jgi:hypothetical protein
MYPVTALLSEAVKLLTETNSEVEVAGMEKAVTTGLVISDTVYVQYTENLNLTLTFEPNVDGIPEDHVLPEAPLPGVSVA